MAYTYDIKTIMTNAWIAARYSAKRHGGKAVEYIKSALKASWRAAYVLRKEEDTRFFFKLPKMSPVEFDAFWDYQEAVKAQKEADEKAFPDNGHDVQYLSVKFAGKSNVNQQSYGEMAEYTFLDNEGNEYVWSTKTNGYYVTRLEAGKKYVISFNHKNYGKGNVNSVKVER